MKKRLGSLLLCLCLLGMMIPSKVYAGQTIYKHDSVITGKSIQVAKGNTVLSIHEEESQNPFTEHIVKTLPSMEDWSNGLIQVTGAFENTADQGWTQIGEFTLPEESVLSYMNQYIELLQDYGFTVDEKSDYLITGYPIFRSYYLSYQGTDIAKNQIQKVSGYSDMCDAEITVRSNYGKDYYTVYLAFPKSVGFGDGSKDENKTYQLSTSYLANYGNYDLFTWQGYGGAYESITLKLKTGSYKTGTTLSLTDIKNGSKCTYRVSSPTMVRTNNSDVYYLLDTSQYGHKDYLVDMKLEVLKKTSTESAIYFYLVFDNQQGNRYTLEGISSYDKNKVAVNKMTFRSNGKTVNVKSGQEVVAVKGTTYQVKKGTTFTLRCPVSGIGNDLYAYAFYANKSGYLKTQQNSAQSQTVTIKAEKKGTVYYKTSLTYSKRVYHTQKIKVGEKYVTSTYYTYAPVTKNYVIRIIIK